MKFLADENVEWPVVVYLRQEGHDVLAIKEVLPGENDEKIFQLALKENRILITNDLDFGKMVHYQKRSSAGIVLMRFASESSEQKIKGIKHLLKFHSKKLDKHFTVVNEDQIKIRPMT